MKEKLDTITAIISRFILFSFVVLVAIGNLVDIIVIVIIVIIITIVIIIMAPTYLSIKVVNKVIVQLKIFLKYTSRQQQTTTNNNNNNTQQQHTTTTKNTWVPSDRSELTDTSNKAGEMVIIKENDVEKGEQK